MCHEHHHVGSLQYHSNVHYLHFEYERFNSSSNLHNNIPLHLTWKLTAISPQQNTFQKPWNQASVLQNSQLTNHCARLTVST